MADVACGATSAALPPGVLRRSTADARRPGRRKSDVERRNGRTRAGGSVAAEPRARPGHHRRLRRGEAHRRRAARRAGRLAADAGTALSGGDRNDARPRPRGRAAPPREGAAANDVDDAGRGRRGVRLLRRQPHGAPFPPPFRCPALRLPVECGKLGRPAGHGVAAPRPARRFGADGRDYLTMIRIPDCAGTSAQTPVGRSPSFSGAASTEGQP